jgi:hypothetical protein
MHCAYNLKFSRPIKCTVGGTEFSINDSAYVARNEYIYKYRMCVDVLNSYISLPLCQFTQLANPALLEDLLK